MTHQRAACDAASVHFRTTITRTDTAYAVLVVTAYIQAATENVPVCDKKTLSGTFVAFLRVWHHYIRLLTYLLTESELRMLDILG